MKQLNVTLSMVQFRCLKVIQQAVSHTAMSAICIALCAALFGASVEPVMAQQQFPGGQVISDGKSGRAWRQWRQPIAERIVERVDATLTKVSGGADTYVNLRFGDGQTFEQGRRVTLEDTAARTVSWSVEQHPKGRPLVLNAYNGEVRVEEVKVFYEGDDTVPQAGASTDEAAGSTTQDDPDGAARCQRGLRTRPPRIEISSLAASGGLFSGKYKISGVISGTCIKEAGYYENNRLREPIVIPLTDSFERQEFRVRTRTGKNGEIRAYTTDGREELISVDELVVEHEARSNK